MADDYTRGFVVPANGGERGELPLGYNMLKASPEQTQHAFVLREAVHPPGVVAASHVHNNDEACWVLEGEYIFDCEDDRLIGTAGCFILLPRLLPHKFHVGPNGGRMLVFGSPAPYKPGESSLEWRPGYFEELEDILKQGALTLEKRMELRTKYGPTKKV